MLSQTAEYALRAMVWIASSSSEFVSSSEIAKGAQIPLDYLSKILHALRLAELLRCKRGINGGFQLARSSETINILQIVQLFGPIRRITHCPLALKKHTTSLCPLHKKLDQIAKELQCHLSSVFLAELIPTQRAPLCQKR